MPARTILKERESKPLLEELKKISVLEQVSHKSRVEIEAVKDAEIVFVDGEPLALKKGGHLVPVLVNRRALDHFPKVVVDMGAVPHIVEGADVMAPGVRNVSGEFATNRWVVVVDEKHGKFLAVGRALQDSSSLASVKKGKFVENLHYVGDPVWEVVKSFARSRGS